jgi:hypothetical protein
VISAESIKPVVEAGKPKPQDAKNIFKIADSNAPHGNEDFEKSEKQPDVPDRYKISDSKELPPKDTVEQPEKNGGSYADVKKTSDGSTSEVHHMPADSTTDLPYNDGPAIKMDKEDHRQTASCGRTNEAQEYRQKQKELIEQDKFREAFQMDVDDIHENFGDKYDGAIADASKYIDKLEEEGRV